MRSIRRSAIGLGVAFVAVVLLFIGSAAGQAGFDDPRVMLQGFYWESYRHGHPDKFPQFGEKRWYDIVREQAAVIRGARFDLIWLPPPSYAGNESAGYGPKEYFRLDNSYGTHEQHRAMLDALLKHGVEPIADVVINHRDGTNSWATFENPKWGKWAITRHDEAFTNADSDANGTPENERGAEEEKPSEYTSHGGTSYSYNVFRDIDHTNAQVRRDIVRYLQQLQSFGYRGWRYDMVHGFHAKHVGSYNRHLTTPATFCVGEFDWVAHNDQRGWIYHTATKRDLHGVERLKTCSSVFDFTTYFTLKANKGRYTTWYGYGTGLGMVGDGTDGLPWKNRAVTFVENHDTGYRTNPDGTPQQGHESDSFANGWEVEQAYAYILTHPGVPSVYWKHYFDWGADLRNKIRALVNARKVAGIHSGSRLHAQQNARAKGVYAAMVEGRDGGHQLCVRVGGGDDDWRPEHSNYANFREYARGAGWTVWVKHPRHPEFQHAALAGELPVPQYTPADQITDVPEDP